MAARLCVFADGGTVLSLGKQNGFVVTKGLSFHFFFFKFVKQEA